MYLAGGEAESGELVNNMNSCSMCKRMIINAGIDRVVIRRTPTDYETVIVRDWCSTTIPFPARRDIDFDARFSASDCYTNC